MAFSVGDIIVLPKSFFDANRFITQYFPLMKPGVFLQIKKISNFVDGLTGVSVLQDIESTEVFDISKVPELADYWCILDSSDNFRVIPQ
ncbi:hypothetical protein Acj9p121 [Acinetobacter phage Acj9]|uniref:Uncharacterized protein n=1 Tax=Acinetobacter phage Acj9 TaxID=760939 RepID=E5EPQ5_9CAUD|nr:hypothetical protein Acj9p121 [Acinetobacter phage Acj9]ADG60021.1 hypothetical protein Acj9p121 [Acinetobacter phage Acj9]